MTKNVFYAICSIFSMLPCATSVWTTPEKDSQTSQDQNVQYKTSEDPRRFVLNTRFPTNSKKEESCVVHGLGV